MVTSLGKVLNKIKSNLSSIYMKVVFLVDAVYVKTLSIPAKVLLFQCKLYLGPGLRHLQTGVFPPCECLARHSEVTVLRDILQGAGQSCTSQGGRHPGPTTKCLRGPQSSRQLNVSPQNPGMAPRRFLGSPPATSRTFPNPKSLAPVTPWPSSNSWTGCPNPQQAVACFPPQRRTLTTSSTCPLP